MFFSLTSIILPRWIIALNYMMHVILYMIQFLLPIDSCKCGHNMPPNLLQILSPFHKQKMT